MLPIKSQYAYISLTFNPGHTGGLPAIAIVFVTERQLSKRQPYHRRVRFRVDFPQAASLFVRYIIVIIHDNILSAVEVAAILCKVATTHCKNEENNLSEFEFGAKVLGRVSLQWNVIPPPPSPAQPCSELTT